VTAGISIPAPKAIQPVQLEAGARSSTGIRPSHPPRLRPNGRSLTLVFDGGARIESAPS